MNPKSAAVVVAALLGCASAARAGDIVQKKDGSFNPAVKGEAPAPADFEASNWQVIAADSENVTYQLSVSGKSVTQKIKAAEVLEIFFEPRDYPGGWKEAANALASGDYANAARGFQEIGAEARHNQVIRQRALLNAARAVAASGKSAEADAAYEHLLKTFPATFYTVHVWKERTTLWTDVGDEAKAKAAAETLLNLPGAGDADKTESKLLLLNIEFRKAAAAKDKAALQKILDAYKAMAQASSGRKEQATVNALARIGMGNCMLELGNAGEAKGIFQEIADRTSATETAVLASAFNGLGECWYRQGDKQGWEEARRCFLRTALLYSEGTSADQIARALYYAGDCFFRLQDTETWAKGARQELQACINRFPTSSWAQKARILLPSIPKSP